MSTGEQGRVPRSVARTVRMLGSADAATDAAAATIARVASEAVAATGRFVLALSGGRTPLPLFDRLSGLPAGEVDWPAVHVFWADERCVEPDAPESNYRAARVHLLDRVPVLPANVRRIRGEMPPPVAADAYRDELAAFFQADMPDAVDIAFDLVLLGVGEDGHVASIFPASPALNAPDWALAVHAPPAVSSRWRVTLTRAAIAAAGHVLVFATGASKAAAVASAFDPSTATPASRLTARVGVTWILDAAAAAALDPP